jgi:hypothetical protein
MGAAWMEGMHGGTHDMGAPTPTKWQPKPDIFLKEAGFKRCLPTHGNLCWAALKPLQHLQHVVQITSKGF